MARSVIIPERSWTADRILTASTLTREDSAAREVRPAIRAAANVGDRDPIPSGLLSGDVDVDILARTSNRFGYKGEGAAAAVYRGKSPANILTDLALLQTATTTGTRLSRPKVLSLASGALLIVWRTGDGGTDGATALRYCTVDPSGGVSSATNVTINSGATTILYGYDVTQLASGEIVLMASIFDTSAYQPQLIRFVSKSDAVGSIAFRQLDAQVGNRGGTGVASPQNTMAIETLASGRIAMLTQDGVAGLLRSYSDDGGATWAEFATAGQFTTGMAASATAIVYGGVGMCRTVNGSLVAVAPCIPGGFVAASEYTQNASHYGLRPLVSDDGDNWNDMLTASARTGIGGATSNSVVSQAAGLLPEGVNEGTVTLGPDGVPKILACMHGSAAPTLGPLADDLIMLSMRKPYVTSADVGRPLNGSEANGIAPTGDYVVTSSDAFDGVWIPTYSCHRLRRMAGTYGPAGVPQKISPFHFGYFMTGELGASPSYVGPRYLDATLHRGAIVTVGISEDTASTTTALWFGQSAEWNELTEFLPEFNDNTAELLWGRTYRNGFGPDLDLTLTGFTFTGAGTPTRSDRLGGGTGGHRIVTVANTGYYSYAGANLPGGNGQPAFLKFQVKLSSGGSATTNDISLTLVLTDGSTNKSRVVFRFFLNGGVAECRVTDDIASTTLGTHVGTTDTLEITARWSAYDTLAFVAIKSVSSAFDTDQELYLGVTLSTNTLATNAGTASALSFGNQVAASADSTWRSLFWARPDTISPVRYSNLQLNAYTTYPAPELYVPNDQDPLTYYDDGLRVPSRPSIMPDFPIYLTGGLSVRWAGGRAAVGDAWTLESRFNSDVTQIVRVPVAKRFRALNDSVDTPIIFNSDAGTRPNPFYRASTAALFGLNCHQFRFQAHTANGWGSPLVNLLVDCSDSADIAREHYRVLAANFSIDSSGSGNEVARVFANPYAFLPHQFRQTDRVTWYVWSSALDQSFTLLDNDENRLYVDGSLAGADTGTDYLAIYCDRLAFDLPSAMSAVAAAGDDGLQYVRILLPAQTTAEGRHQLGYALIGRRFNLANPHPDWEWSWGADARPIILEASSNYRDVVAPRAAPRRFRFPFSGLRDRMDRPTGVIGDFTSAAQKNDFRQYLEFLEAIQWGEQPCVLLPDYNDNAGEATASIKQTAECYPVRCSGPYEAVQRAYEACRTGDGLTKAIMDVQELEFIEIL